MITETEPKTEVFLAKPTDTDRHQNFWNRNNTTVSAANVYISLPYIMAPTIAGIDRSEEMASLATYVIYVTKKAIVLSDN